MAAACIARTGGGRGMNVGHCQIAVWGASGRQLRHNESVRGKGITGRASHVWAAATGRCSTCGQDPIGGEGINAKGRKKQTCADECVYETCKKSYALVPLVYGVVVDEHRLDLHRSKEALIAHSAVVDVEGDRRVLGGDIAAVAVLTVFRGVFTAVVVAEEGR